MFDGEGAAHVIVAQVRAGARGLALQDPVRPGTLPSGLAASYHLLVVHCRACNVGQLLVRFGLPAGWTSAEKAQTYVYLAEHFQPAMQEHVRIMLAGKVRASLYHGLR